MMRKKIGSLVTCCQDMRRTTLNLHQYPAEDEISTPYYTLYRHTTLQTNSALTPFTNSPMIPRSWAGSQTTTRLSTGRMSKAHENGGGQRINCDLDKFLRSLKMGWVTSPAVITYVFR